MPAPNRSLRVVFLSSCVRGGGAGWSLYYLLKHIDRDRIDPIVVVPDRGIFDERFAALQLRVHVSAHLPEGLRQPRFRRHNLLTSTASRFLNARDIGRTIGEVERLVRRHDADVVHCNNMMVKPIGVAASRRAGVPCILHARNVHERPAEVLFYGGLSRLASVHSVIANSSASAEPYQRFAPAKVRVIHNGVDLDDFDAASVPRGRFRQQLCVPSDTFVVGFVGHLIARKGLVPLIEAAARLVQVRRNLVFVVVGRRPAGGSPGPPAEFEALAERLGLGDRFRFVGFSADVRPAVADFDVLALPSFQEPFGRAVIEAMALGTPVVATRVGGIPEIITDGQTGLLVPPGDPAALASAIARLIDDRRLAETMADEAVRQVRDRFDARGVARRVEDVLVRAAATAPSRASAS